MIEQIFISPQVKGSGIISNTVVYKLPHELPIDSRLRILGYYEIPGKSQDFIESLPNGQPSSQNENSFSTSKNLLKKRN